jgi:uncharacterized membrane protein YphA (DoxX/SURF4 family)
MALWVLQLVLAALFLFAGGIKLVTPVEEMLQQIPLPVPGWFLRFTGVVEMLGAVGLVLPWLLGVWPFLTPLAALGLVIVMIGAVIFTALTGDVAMALIPLVVGVLCAFVAYGRWRMRRSTGSSQRSVLQPDR